MGLGGVTADVEAPVRQRCPAVAWMGGRGVPTIFSAVCGERLPSSSTCVLLGLGVSSQTEAAADLVRLDAEFAVGKTCFTPSILGRPTSSCCWCLSLTGQVPERHFSHRCESECCTPTPGYEASGSRRKEKEIKSIMSIPSFLFSLFHLENQTNTWRLHGPFYSDRIWYVCED